jgi:hypothetical protein
VCEKRLNPTPARTTPAAISEQTPVIDGQTAIELSPFQPTLEAI